ncbi:MAG TPA: BrnA antitoxin family protein [Candidatus Melainabacteria bacterium]|nr:BrnA antitoxin family protein [Candidatus Melainabacteria bacterium]
MSDMKPEESKGKTNWEKLRAKRKSAPEPSAAEVEEVRGFWADADVVIPDGKTRMTVRFDTDVVEWFKNSGPKYQTRMNAVLRQFMTAQLEGGVDANKQRVSNVPSDSKSMNEYMEALNQLGRIRLQQGDTEGAAKYFEESIHCYRSHAGMTVNQTSTALLKKVNSRWFGHSRLMGFNGSQEILMDVEENFYTELRDQQ